MSLRALVAVNRCPQIKGAARRAAFQIADAHNEQRGDAWLGYRLMAAREGVTTKTMEIGVRMLEEADFLLVQRRPGRSNYYRLNVERIEALAINKLADCQPQKTASVTKPSSAAKNSDRSTAATFGTVQKSASGKSSSNHIEPSKTHISNPEGEYNGRSRLQWARDIAYYRRKLDSGVTRPIWPFYAGPRPDTSACFAPIDLLQRFGFAQSLESASRGP